MKKILLALFLGFLFITSCDNTKATVDNESGEIIIETEKGNPLLLSEFCSEISYLRLETKNLNPIGTIDKIIIHKERIYILDSKTNKISAFGKNGNFITQTNNIGRGPGEYLNIADFLIDSLNNNIELWDNGNKKVIKMDQNGNFLNEKSLSLQVDKFCKLSPNSYLYYACNSLNPEFFKKESYNAIILDSSNNLISSFLPIRETKYLKSGENNLFVKYGNGVNIIVPYENQLYNVNSDRCKTKYKIKFRNYSPPDNFLDSYNRIDENDRAGISMGFRELLNELNEKSYAGGIHNILENDKILFFQYRVPKIGTYTAIYNKKTKNVRVGIPDNNLDFGLFGEPLALNSDTLLTYIYPSDLIKRVKSLESKESNKKPSNKYLELKKLSDSLQESENPIIAKFVIIDL